MKPIKNEIVNIKEEIEKLKIYNKELEKNLEKNLEEKIEKNFEKKDIKSSIIRYKEFQFIEDELERIYNKNIIKYELLFRASRDGFKISDFQNKCNDKTDTITIVKTTNNKRFGGFTRLAHNNPDRFTNKEDITFSLDNKKIYYYQENNNYNYDSNNYNRNILFFRGKYGFNICDNSNINYSQDYSYNYIYRKIRKDVIPLGNYNNYLSGNPNFLVYDFEVFQIHFETKNNLS